MAFELVFAVDLFHLFDLEGIAGRALFHLHRLKLTVWLRILSSSLPRSKNECIHDAILIARRTLCQFDKTAATANIEPRLVTLSILEIIDSPSVPSDKVESFSSNVCICIARPALRSLSSFRLSSSVFFSLMRATSSGDCVEACEPPMEGCRRLEVSGRLWKAICRIYDPQELLISVIRPIKGYLEIEAAKGTPYSSFSICSFIVRYS